MLKRRFTVGTLAAVAGAALLLTPATSQAQRYRGGSGGGYYGGQSWGHYPGYYGSTNAYSPWAGGYGSRYGYNYGPNYYGYNRYGSWPNYGGYNQYQYAPNSYGSIYYEGQPMYSQGYSAPNYYGSEGWSGNYSQQPGMSGGSYSYGSSAGMNQDPNAANLAVHLPADAQLWFEGEKTSQTGSDRTFVSPPLTPGKNYTYDIKAQWKENGRDVTRTKQVRIRAGGFQRVDFDQADEDRSRRDYGANPSDRTAPFERSAPANRDDATDRNRRGTNPPDQTAPRNPGDRPGTVPPDRSSTPGNARPGTTGNSPPDR